MSCEKASRRLRCIMTKAKRFGITEYELADLSATKKITNLKSNTNTWSIVAVIIILIIGGTIVLAIVCNPCMGRNLIRIYKNSPDSSNRYQ